jgi:hypothetical protein
VQEYAASEITTEVPAIENEADLNNRLGDLENTNIDSINEMLFELEDDAQGL